ncbi:MAG: hypothetical protein ABIO67_00880 [Mycobacteriales bacterium]
MEPGYDVIGQAVLRDYPLRLWSEQQEHTRELLREFTLLIFGQQSPAPSAEAPAQLVELAAMFASRFGPLLDQLTGDRQAAYDAGKDRMDSIVPLVAGTSELMDRAKVVLAAVDDFCRQGTLLALARTPQMVALFDWTDHELATQLAGGDPTPWPGPF